MEEASKQYTTFTIGNLGFFECDHMPFGLCNVLAMFQRLMQNCLSKLNLIYCLIYMDDIVIFLQMAEEHFHQLHVVFDQFREYHLKLKPSKCSFFQRGDHLSDTSGFQGRCATQWFEFESNHRMCTTPNLHRGVSLSHLVGHYQWLIKGFACIAQLLNDHLMGEGASRKSEWVSLSEDALKAFRALNQACMTTPVLAFADYTKPFLLQTDASKDGLGAVLFQKQADRWYHPVASGSRALMPHEKNYHLTKLEFLALKWAVMEHFKEYLLYQPFLVKTDNPLTYIMMTPNLDATGHWWVRALARFNFQLEYQKGCDNTVVDVLSWVTTCLHPDMVRSILKGVTLGAAHQTKVHDPTIVKGDHGLEKEVHVATGHMLVQMHVTD